MTHEITAYDDAHRPAVAALAARSLDLPEDLGETGAILDRLLAPPPGRRVFRLASVDPAAGPRGVAYASVSDTDPAIGYLDLIAVDPGARRHGIGRALVEAAEQALAAAGVREVHLAGHAPCYAWPGIDVRYTPAVCAALALGYTQSRTGLNMTVDLAAVPEGAAAQARLAAAGISARAATPADIPALGALIGRHFGGGWAWEVAEAINRGATGAAAGCHLAERAPGPASAGLTQVLGFAAYGALRPSLFGPMGTDPAAQGTGIGAELLRRCLRDQRAAGLATAQIGWAGPIAFYSTVVGARIGRVFHLYQKRL